MRKFFEKNKIFLAIFVGALIAGTAFYFGLNKSGGKVGSKEQIKCLVSSETIVTKVIDGDTIIVEGGEHIRLLGIDADERGYPCYEPAKKRIEELILNKEVKLEKDKTDVDQYKRCLRYIFIGSKNVDLELVKEGLAIARFYEPNIKYKDEITAAEKEAIKNKIGCKWSGRSKENSQVLEETKLSGFQWRKLTAELTNLEVVDACDVGNYIGKKKIVEGKVVDSYRSKTNTVFLNFDKPYPNHCFTGVLFSSDQYKFVQNPEDYYLNKTLRVKGKIKDYKGKAEIILENPSQIEIGK